jgi:hypothetical protein
MKSHVCYVVAAESCNLGVCPVEDKNVVQQQRMAVTMVAGQWGECAWMHQVLAIHLKQ